MWARDRTRHRAHRVHQWVRKTGVTLLGWLLLIAGVVALVLPGPGLLLMLAGLVTLSKEYLWAARRVEPIRTRAFALAAYGVETWPRIVASALGGLGVMAAGVVWFIDPEIPEVWVFGPRLPLGGPTSGLWIVLSGVLALGLVAYSFRRFRGNADESVTGRTSYAKRD